MEQEKIPQTLLLDYVSPATRLLEKRRQMFEVQEALDAQKEEFRRREDAFRRREDALRRRDLELQESLIKFNKFLQENESKRHRALKRASDERKHIESKEQELGELKKKMEERSGEEEVLRGELEKHLRYQDYLEEVIHFHAKDFPEIEDLLTRLIETQIMNYNGMMMIGIIH